MKRKAIWSALTASALVLSACNALGITCPDVGRHALVVEVREAGTGANAVPDAILLVRDGEYMDSVQGQADGPAMLAAAPEWAGTYSVIVRKVGYEEWTRNDLRVRRSGACNALGTVNLVADLQPVQTTP
ncbi:MAG: hypothetical protein H0X65_10655 [Gemmatimonadetes bacterium]|nr:hypothetical protein [Gemmatimonadota bacterium]